MRTEMQISDDGLAFILLRIVGRFTIGAGWMVVEDFKTVPLPVALIATRSFWTHTRTIQLHVWRLRLGVQLPMYRVGGLERWSFPRMPRWPRMFDCCVSKGMLIMFPIKKGLWR